MSTLSTADRTKLAKLLGLLASDHAGERDAAALAANRLVQSRGVTWAEVVQPPPPVSRPFAMPKPFTEINVWRQVVDRCLQRPGSLRQWELKFLFDLHGFPRLSAKQRVVLNDIADRVLGAGVRV